MGVATSLLSFALRPLRLNLVVTVLSPGAGRKVLDNACIPPGIILHDGRPYVKLQGDVDDLVALVYIGSGTSVRSSVAGEIGALEPLDAFGEGLKSAMMP